MNDPDLLDRLRQLFVHAQRDGADPVWLADSADALVAKVLGLRLDPRRRRSHAEADRLGIVYAGMREAGHSRGAAVAALCRRTGLSRSRVYALLNMSCDFTGRNTG